MFSKPEAGTGERSNEGSGHAKLLRDIDSMNKDIYPDNSHPKGLNSTNSSRSRAVGKTNFPDTKQKPRNSGEHASSKDKKTSFWNWKPLKAFSRNRRFTCCFSLQVHCIEGLPPGLENADLRVHWKRRDGELLSPQARVSDGRVEFEERLTHVCSISGSRNGPHHSAKYEAKHFLLFASVVGAPEVDLGKHHRVDLTRLLPVTLEELEEEKNSGKWTTSFKLAGKAKGATLHVSFGYLVIDDKSDTAINNLPEGPRTKQNPRIGRSETLPAPKSNQISHAQSVENIKVLHEVLPVLKSELTSSVNLPHQKLDEDKLDDSIDYRPELDVFTERVDPFKPTSDSLPDLGKGSIGNDLGDNKEFSVIDHGMELPLNEQVKSYKDTVRPVGLGTSVENGTELPLQEHVKLDEDIVTAVKGSSVDGATLVENDGDSMTVLEENTELPSLDEEVRSYGDIPVLSECSSEADTYNKESLLKELESAANIFSNSVDAGLESPIGQENSLGKSNFRMSTMKARSHSLDDMTRLVATEFLDMMGVEHSPFCMSSESEPDSPRERLLRQFEKETLATGCSLFDFGPGDEDQAVFNQDDFTCFGWGNSSEDLEALVQAAAEEHQIATQRTQAPENRTRAKVLEDTETQALMREWGLNEEAFQCSPSSSGGFGSPIHVPPEDPFQLPPLGNGLGPFVHTNQGGFLRSMNPAHFRNSKSGGSLIMQVSRPVVVPAEMGSGIMDILQRLASVGIEKLSRQASKLMPLEDITGSTMQQIAWEASPSLGAPERSGRDLRPNLSCGRNTIKEGKSSLPRSNDCISSTGGKEIDSDYVSLDELAPMAMDKIEALSIEGLRIQSGMSNEDGSSNISLQSIGVEGKRANLGESLGLEGAAGLQLLDIKEGVDNIDGLMSLSLTLDEWMRLDAGEINEEDQISDRTSKILAAHHATDVIYGGLKGGKRGKGSKRKCGLLANNFTVALMVQLRDPLRNYEPVGAPMLALIQVERVFVPPKPKIYSTISELKNSYEEVSEAAAKDKKKKIEKKKSLEEGIAQFKITEVHVAGLKNEPGSKKQLWGTKTQQQAGSRWLLANGMGKNSQNPFMKSKAISKTKFISAAGDTDTAKVQLLSDSKFKSTPAVAAKSATKAQRLGDSLWSVSSWVRGTGSKWKEPAVGLNPPKRNPNVIFPR